jgi:hypothetical protein
MNLSKKIIVLNLFLLSLFYGYANAIERTPSINSRICDQTATHSVLSESEYQYCSKLMTFKEKFSDTDIRIIYSTETVNNPMSFFGHFALLFYSEEMPMFSPVFMFTADTSGNITLSQYLDGAFGSLPASYKVVNYYEYLDKYLYTDERSVVEVGIKSLQGNDKWLIEEMFRLINTTDKYNFFFRNCTSELIKLINTYLSLSSDIEFTIPENYIEFLISKDYGEVLKVRAPHVEQLKKIKNIDFEIASRICAENGLSEYDKSFYRLASHIKFRQTGGPVSGYHCFKNARGYSFNKIEIENKSYWEFGKNQRIGASVVLSKTIADPTFSFSAFEKNHKMYPKYPSDFSELRFFNFTIDADSNFSDFSLFEIKAIKTGWDKLLKPSWTLNLGWNDVQGVVASFGIGPTFEIKGMAAYFMPTISNTSLQPNFGIIYSRNTVSISVQTSIKITEINLTKKFGDSSLFDLKIDSDVKGLKLGISKFF